METANPGDEEFYRGAGPLGGINALALAIPPSSFPNMAIHEVSTRSGHTDIPPRFYSCFCSFLVHR